MAKVAIYTRVSTTLQADEGYSLEEQINKLKSYCDIKDWTVYKVYSDGGFTGSNIERPAMTNLVSDAKAKKFDTVLVYKLDRLSRSQKDTLYLIEEVFIKNDINFLSLNENFDTSSAFGKAMIGILSVFAQLEREQIKERMMLGKVGRAKSGKSMMWGKSSYGYEYHKKNGSMEIVPGEAIIVKKIFELYVSGKSITKLRDYLNENNLLTNKKVKWSYQATRGVLTNPVYCGLIRYDGQIYPGLHEPIISKEMFDLTQEIIKERQMTALTNCNPRPFKAKYMLSGIGRCGYCGAPLKIMLGRIRNDGTRTIRYDCTNRFPRKTKPITVYNDYKKCNSGYYYKDDVEKVVLDRIYSLQLDNDATDKIFGKDEIIDNSKIEKEIKQINLKIEKLNDLYLNDLISLEELKSKTTNLINQKKLLEDEITDRHKKKENPLKKQAIKTISNKNIYELSYEDQALIVKSLINRIYVKENEIQIEWKN